MTNRLLTEDIRNAQAQVVAPAPILHMHRSYDGGINLMVEGKATCGYESAITDIVLNSARTRVLTHNSGPLEVIVEQNSPNSVAEQCSWRIQDEIRNFLHSYQVTKNNRLTNTYKWYHKNLSTMDRDIDFENDIYTVYKYIVQIKKSSPLQAGHQPALGAVSALELIKKKHEARGKTL